MSNGNRRLGEQRSVFAVGPVLDGEPVTRTFQPSYVVMRDGAIAAFCQGRFGKDNDPKQILMTRSRDGGATWERARALTAPMNHFAVSAYAQTTADGRERLSILTIVDLWVTKRYYNGDEAQIRKRTGIDLAVVGRETPMVLCRFDSDDDGETWTMEALLGNRTPLGQVHNGWTLTMANPIGQVHLIPDGPHQGRLIIGCPLAAVPPGAEISANWRDHQPIGSAAMHSDDHGETWHIEGVINDYLGDECSVVSLRGGEQLYMIRRSRKKHPHRPEPHPLLDQAMQRMSHLSRDGGRTWSPFFALPLSGLTCHGTLRSVRGRWLFSIPLGSMRAPRDWGSHLDERYQGAVYVSEDEGKTWRYRIVEPGSFSYSTVGSLTPDSSLVMYASGPMGQEGVQCRVLPDEWLFG